MKDYFDIWLLTETFEFESQSLQRALKTTFSKRETELPTERPAALSIQFALDNQTRWDNFRKKLKLQDSKSNSLKNVIEQIWKFLQEPLQSSIDKSTSDRTWLLKRSWK